MKLSPSILDEISLTELGWLIENHFQEEMDYFETMSTAFAFGYSSAKKGKKIHMYKKREEDKVKQITIEEKNEELSYLDKMFADFS
jgi:hypothetical protein